MKCEKPGSRPWLKHVKYGTVYLNAAIAEEAVDEVAEDVLGVLGMPLDAHNVVAKREHLHAGFLGKGDDLSTRGDFPHLILMALDYRERFWDFNLSLFIFH